MNNSLVNFRNNNSLTQQCIASKIGVTHTYYSKIELGLRNPSYNFILKFKAAFPDADIDEIFFEEKSHVMCTILN